MYLTTEGHRIWVQFERGERTGPLLDTDSESLAKRCGNEAVLLLHGFPDSGVMWHSQVTFEARKTVKQADECRSHRGQQKLLIDVTVSNFIST